MWDNTRIRVIGGYGGNGAISFRRERYLPRGGPDGGDGGRGGDVFLQAEHGCADLWGIRDGVVVRGEDGQDGQRGGKRGKDGKPKVVSVPLGTVVWERSGNCWGWRGQLVEHGQQLLVARGGEGGRGNVHFASAVNKTPRLAEEGVAGETKELFLELRLLADVGLIGQPNAGKSLLMRRVATATPEVAAYPFTTREAVLGVVEKDWQTFSIVELPGIVRGASQGKGLGNTFLRHLWRVRLLIHLIDGEVQDPCVAIQEVNAELGYYAPPVQEKPQIVVVNKIDLSSVAERLPVLRKQLAPYGVARHFVSALTGEGVEGLVTHIQELLGKLPPAPEVGPPRSVSEATAQRSHQLSVTREGAVFVVSSPRAERLVRLPDLGQFQVRLQLRGELAKLGVVRALEEAGIQPGDRVRIGRVEFQWE